MLPHRGVMFARAAIAKAVTKSHREAVDFARTRWGAKSPVVEFIKADVAGAESTDADFDAADTGEVGAEFADLAASQTLVDRAGFVRVASGVPFIAATSGGTASWIAGGKAIPVSRSALDRSVLRAKKVGALQVFSRPLLEDASERVERMVLTAMLRTAARAVDAALIDPAGSGDAATPASLTSGATPIASAGDLADDVDAAIGAYAGDLNLSSAVWMMNPRHAAQAGIRAGATGLAADLGARGGTLAGLPVYTSESVPVDSTGGLLVLVDAASVALLDEGYEVRRAEHATVEMSDSPSGDIIAPATAGDGTKWVSLFQEDAVGLLLIRRVNWHLARADAIVVVDGVDYSAV
jgi:HK97 family phage major capsid protein